MAQIIPRSNFLGESLERSLGPLGTGMAQGMSTGLQALANMKLQELSQRTRQQQVKQGLMQYFPEGQATSLALLPDQLLAPILKEKAQEPRNQAFAQGIQSLFGPIETPIDTMAQQQFQQTASPAVQQGQPQQRATQQTTMPPQLSSQQALQLAQLGLQKQKMERRELEEKRKLEFAEKQTTLKETKAYVDTLKSKEKAAQESSLRLNRMKTLIEKGKLPNAALWSFLSKLEDIGPLATGGVGALLGTVVPGAGTLAGAAIGGVAGALSSPLAGAAKSLIRTGSPDIEEFEKLSADFVKNAKQYFGNRLTDADLRVFMQTLPNLMQTDAGKKKIIDNLNSLNELADVEAKVARSIIKANKGMPPIDIEQQVKDKISKKVDKIAKKFINQ